MGAVETFSGLERKKVLFGCHTYGSDELRSDGDENSEVIWMDVNEALTRDDVPGLTKDLMQIAINGKEGFKRLPYDSVKDCPNSLWGI